MADQETWRKNLPEGFDGRHGDGEEWDSEVSVKPILWSTVAIVLSLLIALAFNWWLIVFFEDLKPEPELSPIAEANERRLPPSPWLQPSPEMELDEYLAEIEDQQASYGWVDALDERVRIPVERAVELVLAEQAAVDAPESIEPSADPAVDAEIEPATEPEAVHEAGASGH